MRSPGPAVQSSIAGMRMQDAEKKRSLANHTITGESKTVISKRAGHNHPVSPPPSACLLLTVECVSPVSLIARVERPRGHGLEVFLGVEKDAGVLGPVSRGDQRDVQRRRRHALQKVSLSKVSLGCGEGKRRVWVTPLSLFFTSLMPY